jgi:hypothetical protein
MMQLAGHRRDEDYEARGALRITLTVSPRQLAVHVCELA